MVPQAPDHYGSGAPLYRTPEGCLENPFSIREYTAKRPTDSAEDPFICSTVLPAGLPLMPWWIGTSGSRLHDADGQHRNTLTNRQKIRW